MRIEGTIASSAAVSDQALTAESAAVSQTRDAIGHEATHQQTFTNPDATTIASEQRAVGPRLLSSAVNAIERLLGDVDNSLALRIHKVGRKLTVRVVNRESNEVVREVSSAEFLGMLDSVEGNLTSSGGEPAERLAAARRWIAGLFVNERQ